MTGLPYGVRFGRDHGRNRPPSRAETGGRRKGPSPIATTVSPGVGGAMVAAPVDGTPWPCDVASAEQGDRPSSVGQDGRSWGDGHSPGDRPRLVRGKGRAAVSTKVRRIAHEGDSPPAGGTSEEPARVPPSGRHHGGASPIKSGEPKPPALFKCRGAGRTSPRAESPNQCDRRGPSQTLGHDALGRLWHGRVNSTLGWPPVRPGEAWRATPSGCCA